ncbi:putative phage terminase large subunit-like protein [Devosia subaequoris]|uniref:Putative phage terminase large subunit-like protein n=1 Tax=Devosia subaequoris TaxID=395930 RepID=A0A7W6IKG3_9HYPH|nr:putative phage terminase large subunit-like protein [Devosia subaequoris]MCP1211427.1 phage terminase large subunit [Devosia subaequoris]
MLQQLHREQREQETRYLGIVTKLDRRTRFEAQTARLATGNYLLPIEASWLTDLRRELLAFPNGRYDDQVDSLVQFLEWSASPRAKCSLDRDPVTGRPIGRLPRRRG